MSIASVVQQVGRPSSVQVENGALIAAASGFLISLLVGVIAFAGAEVPLSGESSVGQLSALMAVVLGATATAIAYVRGLWPTRHLESRRRRLRNILDTVAITLTSAAIAMLLVFSIYRVLQSAFAELVLDPFPAAIIVGITAAVACYVLYLVAAQMTTYRLSTLLMLFLIGGVLAAMLTAADPHWWQSNFSALGMGSSEGTTSAWAFNITLILAGLVMVAMSDYLTSDLRVWAHARGGVTDRTLNIVTGGLALVGAMLAGVGLVPVDKSFILHNTFATGMTVVFGVLIVAVPLMIPTLPGGFRIASFGFFGLIIVCVLLFWPVGYFNLTAVELIAFIAIFAWIVLFVRTVAAALDDQGLAVDNAGDAVRVTPRSAAVPAE